MPEQTMTIGHTGEGEYRRLPVGEGGDVGHYDSGRGEAILLVHAGVFSDWFGPLSLELPRDRFRVVRVRRCGYRGHHTPGHAPEPGRSRPARCRAAG